MKVLYLAVDAVPSPKGAGVRIARTVRTLTGLGHRVELFTSAGVSEQALEVADHQRCVLPAGNFLERMVFFRRAARDWLAGREGDLVQFRSIWEGLPALARARELGARVVFEAHGFPSIELPYHYPQLHAEPAVLERLIDEENQVLHGADLLLSHSQTGRRYLLSRGVDPARVAVVPNAVDAELFSPGAAPPADGLPLRLVYVGTLAPWQGLGTVLEALTRFRAGGEVVCHSVGPLKSAWRRMLKGYARKLRVHHQLQLSEATGQENLVPVMRSAHACVAALPDDPRNTVQGCCPIKLLEYMAVGRPVLSTRIAPVLEICAHERDAHLVTPQSPAALADGIAWLRDHPDEREALGARARERVLAEYGPQHFVARLGAALEQLG